MRDEIRARMERARWNDPRTAPLVPVFVSIDVSRRLPDPVEFGDLSLAEYQAFALTAPWNASALLRGWDRSTGEVIEYAGKFEPETLRRMAPDADDLEWLRNIGAIS